MPALSVRESGGVVSLRLDGVASGEGASLQEAADDLIGRLLGIVTALRAGGIRASSEALPDVETIDLLWELGEIAAAGGDIRERVFG